jgi:hypothetical protein
VTANRRIPGPGRLAVGLRVLVLATVLVVMTLGLGSLVVGALAPATAAWRTAGTHGLLALPPDRAVTTVAVLALAGCWLWLLATGVPFAARTTLALLRSTSAPGTPSVGSLRPRAARPGRAPRLTRLCVLLALGGQGLLVTAPAGAVLRSAPSALSTAGGAGDHVVTAGGGQGKPAPPASGAAPDLDGLPLPERVDAPAAAVHTPSARPLGDRAATRPRPHQRQEALPDPPTTPGPTAPDPGSTSPGPAPRAPRAPAAATTATAAPAAGVLVRAGDSLWRIAAARLAPPGADPATVARAVERLRAANRTRLGPDPDLIFPGTHLVLPSAAPDREDHR